MDGREEEKLARTGEHRRHDCAEGLQRRGCAGELWRRAGRLRRGTAAVARGMAAAARGVASAARGAAAAVEKARQRWRARRGGG
jgi:hypothetical protein